MLRCILPRPSFVSAKMVTRSFISLQIFSWPLKCIIIWGRYRKKPKTWDTSFAIYEEYRKRRLVLLKKQSEMRTLKSGRCAHFNALRYFLLSIFGQEFGIVLFVVFMYIKWKSSFCIVETGRKYSTSVTGVIFELNIYPQFGKYWSCNLDDSAID